MAPVIFYRYESSQFARKLENMLVLKGIPYMEVEVSPIPPRPELSILGIGYRRIPVLAIGSDVYCDTALIAEILERRFPDTLSLFPPRKDGGQPDTGLVKALVSFWIDRTVFWLATGMLPWETIPEDFLKDRSEFLGEPIDRKQMTQLQPFILTRLLSHITLIEEQLQDGREWLFDTVSPGFVDVAVHLILSWIEPFPSTQGMLDPTKFPTTLAWFHRIETFLAERKKALKIQNITKEQATELIWNVAPVDSVPFEAKVGECLHLKPGMRVSITPDDTGRKAPTVGKLIGLNEKRVVIETQGSKGKTAVHFPLLGYVIEPAKEEKARL